MNIYYCYEIKTGRFSGSGVTEVNDDVYSSTMIPCPEHDSSTEVAIFKDGKWNIDKL
jgi:hypothetical protein